jgi:DNA-binding transcriptional ArsR family regulator
MARAATTTDVFNAIAEPRRREIIGILSNGEEWAVNDVVAKVDIAQPTVSKHLGVLLKVGVVSSRKRRSRDCTDWTRYN